MTTTRKNKGTAYLLFFTLGFFGVHRMYLKKWGTGVFYPFLFILATIIWWIDLFTLGSQVQEYNNHLDMQDLKTTSQALVHSQQATVNRRA